MSTQTLERALKVQTDTKRMRAFIRPLPDEDYSGVTEDDLTKALGAESIAITDAVKQQMAAFLALCQAGSLPAEEFTLAEGRAPTEPQNATFTFIDEIRDEDEADGEAPADSGLDSIDFFSQCQIRTIEADGVIGKLTQSIPGRSGVDVLGASIPPARKPASIALGDNVILDDDNETVRAKVDGKVHYVNRHLSVQPVVEVKGNIDFETGSMNATTDVLVRGNIQDGFHVHTTRNLSVNGFIEGAEVKAAGDVQVRGGIAGKNKGTVEAGGQIIAKFCNEANLKAQGDIVFAKESLNSTLHTEGFLRMGRGALIGGKIFARCGGDVKIVGSEANVHTRIALGIHPDVIRECLAIEQQAAKQREAAGKIRDAVKPLMAQLKRLLPAQRERATELMYQADELEGAVQAMLAKKDTMLKEASPAEDPFLFVATVIHSGVTIIIGDRMTTFTKQLQGPTKIMRRRVNRVLEMVAVNDLSGGVTVLHSREFVPEPA